MKTNKALIIGLILVLVLILAGAGFWYFWLAKNESETSTDQEIQFTEPKTSPEKFAKSVFFIHHSTGEIYWEGGMRQALEDAGYEAAAPWWEGDTDPADFYYELSNEESWQILEPYSIIIFKSCFPASDITTDAMLEEYKENYNKLYEIYRAHPDKLFVPLSTPPLLASHTSAAAAQKALDFESWLIGEYKDNYDGKNLAPFELYSLLSDSEGFLSAEFIESSDDDHPNAYSGQILGPAIVKHLSERVE